MVQTRQHLEEYKKIIFEKFGEIKREAESRDIQEIKTMECENLEMMRECMKEKWKVVPTFPDGAFADGWGRPCSEMGISSKDQIQGQGAGFQLVLRDWSLKCLADVQVGISRRQLNKQVWSLGKTIRARETDLREFNTQIIGN